MTFPKRPGSFPETQMEQHMTRARHIISRGRKRGNKQTYDDKPERAGAHNATQRPHGGMQIAAGAPDTPSPRWDPALGYDSSPDKHP